MPTARERARASASELAYDQGFEAATGARWEIDDMADAASDVWEPLLERAYVLLEIAQGDPLTLHPDTVLAVWLRDAKEALGRAR